MKVDEHPTQFGGGGLAPEGERFDVDHHQLLLPHWREIELRRAVVLDASFAVQHY